MQFPSSPRAVALAPASALDFVNAWRVPLTIPARTDVYRRTLYLKVAAADWGKGRVLELMATAG